MQRMDAENFLTAPVGGYVAGKSFLIWCASPTLWGTVLWGTPDSGDAREIVRFWRPAQNRGGYDFILDAGGLRSVDPEALSIICQAVRESLDRHAEAVRRQLLLLPRDPLAGAVVAGVPVLLESRHPFRSFLNADEGLAWLGRADLPRRELNRIVAAAQAECGTLNSLRAHLSEHLDAASLDQVSRALRCSKRTLQRELGRQGSSFRAELRRARIAAAARLLQIGDLKIEAVAWQVGYVSTSHFVAAFLRETGQEPSAFRRAHKSVNVATCD
jgi:AraC-like DNA-binding protein